MHPCKNIKVMKAVWGGCSVLVILSAVNLTLLVQTQRECMGFANKPASSVLGMTITSYHTDDDACCILSQNK